MSSSRTGILTGAASAVAALERAGVEVAFGLPGVHNLALWRALGESPIRLVGVRHEQTAAYAADGYARATGRLGVALTTTGPGRGQHARGRRRGLGLAPADPGDRHRHPDPRCAARASGAARLHEATDQAAMFEPVVKRTYRVTAADELAGTLQAAALDGDDPAAAPGLRRDPNRPVRAPRQAPVPGRHQRLAAAREPDDQHVRRTLELLEHARRPLIWAGGGALQADAGRGGRASRGAAGGARDAHLLRARPAAARPRLPGRGNPARGAGRRAVGRGRRRDRDRHRLRRNDDPGLEAAPAAPPDLDQRRPRRRLEELPPRRAGRIRRRRGRSRASRSASPSAAGSTRSRSACAS